MEQPAESTYDIHPSEPRWTHIALRVENIDATIDWYTSMTPLELIERREDDGGIPVVGVGVGHAARDDDVPPVERADLSGRVASHDGEPDPGP